MYTNIPELQNFNEKNHLGESGIAGSEILKCILKKLVMKVL
jgi:hypothetical protein